VGETGAPQDSYIDLVSSQSVPGGVVHELPADLRKALIANPTALDARKDITPLARNEFICWVEDAKQEMTRERRIRRAQDELEDGQRRPCCWPACSHRERTGR
jgi:Bacteriocin-protection, YdeI or OmpD-Associated